MDSVGALEQLRLDGKIAAIGLSNVTAAQLDAALATAPIAAVQNRLSYSDPADLPTALACAERGVAYLADSPFGGPSGTPPEAALSGRRTAWRVRATRRAGVAPAGVARTSCRS